MKKIFILTSIILLTILVACNYQPKTVSKNEVDFSVTKLNDYNNIESEIYIDNKKHRYVVAVKGQFGYINSEGLIVIDSQYKEALSFKEGMAIVGNEEKNNTRYYGYIDTSGKMQIEAKYFLPSHFSEGLATVAKWNSREYYYIDKMGTEILKVIADRAYPFKEGLAMVMVEKDGNKIIGFINKQGDIVIELKDYYIGDIYEQRGFADGLANVCMGGKYGYIDRDGNIAINFDFGYAKDFSEGLAAVKQNEKYGFINESGEIIIPYQFDDVSSFSEDLAAVKVNDLWGFIDKNGEFVIEPMFHNASNFSEGLASVSILKEDEKRYGYLDKKGKFVIEPKFESVRDFENGLAMVFEPGGLVENKWGYINKDGFYVWYPSK